MRYAAKPRIDPAPLEAFRASLRDWLVSLLVWLVETFEPYARADTWIGKALIALKRELDLDLRGATRDLRMLLIAHAFARLPAFAAPAFNGKGGRRPANIAPHLRRTRESANLNRRFVGGALKGFNVGALRQRAERLKAALDQLEPLIEAVLAQMTAMYLHIRRARLVLVFAPAAPLAGAHPRAALAADTS